jgi:hypothetical protein
MAHFAELDENNVVLRTIVVETRDTSDANGVEKESIGIAFLESLLGGTWKKTSYNTVGGTHKEGGTPFRANYAGIGSIYDPVNDVFYTPQPYPSWTISAPDWIWKAPTPMPDDKNAYVWNETNKAWDKVW